MIPTLLPSCPAIRAFLKASGVDIAPDRYVKVKRDAALRERLEEAGRRSCAT
jgi:hypothetical protein